MLWGQYQLRFSFACNCHTFNFRNASKNRYLPNSLQWRYDLIMLGRKENTWSLILATDTDISLILFHTEEMHFSAFERISVKSICIIQRLFENLYLPDLMLKVYGKLLVSHFLKLDTLWANFSWLTGGNRSSDWKGTNQCKFFSWRTTHGCSTHWKWQTGDSVWIHSDRLCRQG